MLTACKGCVNLFYYFFRPLDVERKVVNVKADYIHCYFCRFFGSNCVRDRLLDCFNESVKDCLFNRLLYIGICGWFPVDRQFYTEHEFFLRKKCAFSTLNDLPNNNSDAIWLRVIRGVARRFPVFAAMNVLIK